MNQSIFSKLAANNFFFSFSGKQTIFFFKKINAPTPKDFQMVAP
jgi:hypothetical protein